MALLPLVRRAHSGDPELVSTNDKQTSNRCTVLSAAARLARRFAGVLAECHQAQRRLLELQLSADRYLTDPDSPPDTYEEFLFRTSGLLRHEPPARKRAHSRW